MTEEVDTDRSSRSPFGGHPVNKLAKVSKKVVAALERVYLDEVEQVLAAASIDSVRPSLEEIVEGAGQKLGALVDLLSAAIPPAVTASVRSPTMTSFHLGALEPDADVNHLIQTASDDMPITALPAMPANVNYSKLMPPVRNQGGRGTCVAHALTAVHEFYRRMSGQNVEFSEQFLYHETKLIDGSPTVCGTWQVKAARVLSQLGECREITWPYNPVGPCNNNGSEPVSARTDAANFKLQTIVLPPTNVSRIKASLAGGAVVGFSIPVYDSWFRSPYTKQTGRINMRLAAEPSVGGHAMCLIGYQDDDAAPGGGFFILRNSWDTTWGTQCPYGAGNGTIPYEYISKECWEAVTSPAPPTGRDLIAEPEIERRTQEDTRNIGSGRPRVIIDTGGRYDILIR
jgi:C1A family cysteine protease